MSCACPLMPQMQLSPEVSTADMKLTYLSSPSVTPSSSLTTTRWPCAHLSHTSLRLCLSAVSLTVNLNSYLRCGIVLWSQNQLCAMLLFWCLFCTVRARPPVNLSSFEAGDGGQRLQWSSPYPPSSSLNQNLTYQLGYRTQAQDFWTVSHKHIPSAPGSRFWIFNFGVTRLRQ